jgi:hypothetical protein
LHDDQDCLRYVWRNCELENPVTIFRMLSVTFGIVSSPFQAIHTVHKHAEKFGELFPNAEKAIKKDLYMDDLVTGCTSVEETKNLAHELLQLFQKASMTPHKWAANHPGILDGIPPHLCSQSATLKILGMHWDPGTDTIRFENFSKIDFSKSTVTKRTLLSQIGSIFDPMGLLNPLTLTAKLLFQALWQEKLGWDDPIPDSLQVDWSEWKEDIFPLREQHRPRCLADETNGELLSSTILAFGDASNVAYGTAVYVKSVYATGHVECKLCRDQFQT